MSLNLLMLRIQKDIENKSVLPISKRNKKKNKKEEHSPKTLKKTRSNDNFMKFQWPWTL